jgi:hypothetical protein
MSHKFWLMPGLDFHKLRAEMSAIQSAYVLRAERLIQSRRCPPPHIGLVYKPSSHAELRSKTKCPEQH